MKRFLASLALVALATPAIVGAQAPERQTPRETPRGPGSGYGQRGGYADPSAAVAAEIAFARLARDKGQWSAFKATAAADAVMFAPAMVLAQAWLKNRPNPAIARTWQPHRVWSSCDGSLMVTNGAWQRGDTRGWFTTVWQRQAKGGYKWVFDHGDTAAAPLEAPEMIEARIADCPERRVRERPAGGAPPGGRNAQRQREKPPVIPFDPAARQGRSDDGTLTWQVTADTAGTRDFSAKLMVEGQMREFRKEHVAGG